MCVRERERERAVCFIVKEMRTRSQNRLERESERELVRERAVCFIVKEM